MILLQVLSRKEEDLIHIKNGLKCAWRYSLVAFIAGALYFTGVGMLLAIIVLFPIWLFLFIHIGEDAALETKYKIAYVIAVAIFYMIGYWRSKRKLRKKDKEMKNG